MSYILEALKKAEAERRSGSMQAAPLPPGLAGAGREGGATAARRWLWPAAALAAALSVTAWLALRDSTPPPVVVAAAAPLHAPAAAPAVVPDTAPVGPPAVAPAAEPSATAPAPEKPVQQKPAKKKPEKTPPPARVVAASAPQPSAAETAAGTLHDLPAHIRNEIPPLGIGGYIYSGNRADRSVLINKRLLREGDEIAPGFTLEQMTRDGMVLNYKGYRYRTSY